jgi:hypothetical protein
VLVDDELITPCEDVQQRGRTVRADQHGCGVDLGHRQASAGRRDGVALPSVGLLPSEERGALAEPSLSVHDGRGGRGFRVCHVALLQTDVPLP